MTCIFQELLIKLSVCLFAFGLQQMVPITQNCRSSEQSPPGEFFENYQLEIRHAVRNISWSQEVNYGAGWSSGQALGLLTLTQWVRDTLCSSQAKCPQQDFLDGMREQYVDT